MPSMSYCMFENTAGEMVQVLDAMDQAESVEDLDLNQYEKPAYHEMYDLCKEFIRLYEQLEAVHEVD